MISLPGLALTLILSLQQAAEASPANAGISSFNVDWPAAEVPHWSIEIGADRTGRYDRLEEGAKPSPETRHPIRVSAVTEERLRSGYRTVAAGTCETKIKHLAQTGSKRLAYTTAGSDDWSSCTFNYSDDKGLMDAVAAFQAIAQTMVEGEKLQHAHRYDRLGLDALLDGLVEDARNGRAIEMQNIATVLQSIADDERVIDRARRKAARLLQDDSATPSPR